MNKELQKRLAELFTEFGSVGIVISPVQETGQLAYIYFGIGTGTAIDIITVARDCLIQDLKNKAPVGEAPKASLLKAVPNDIPPPA